MKYTKLLLPAVLTGTEDRRIVENLKHFRRSKITARTGELMEMHLPPGKGGAQTLHAATDEILCRIAALLPGKYRGVYPDHPRLKEFSETHA